MESQGTASRQRFTVEQIETGRAAYGLARPTILVFLTALLLTAALVLLLSTLLLFTLLRFLRAALLALLPTLILLVALTLLRT